MHLSTHIADEIKWRSIQEICPEKSAKLTAVLSKYGADQEDLAIAFGGRWDQKPYLQALWGPIYDSDGGADLSKDAREEYTVAGVKEITAAFKDLCADFIATTTVDGAGLTLRIACHGEDGCIHDSQQFAYWYVDGAYRVTPAGKKYRMNLAQRMYSMAYSDCERDYD